MYNQDFLHNMTYMYLGTVPGGGENSIITTTIIILHTFSVASFHQPSNLHAGKKRVIVGGIME